jgi:hypothetical protein
VQCEINISYGVQTDERTAVCLSTLFYMLHSFPPAHMTRECFAFVERNPAELLKEIHYPHHNRFDYDAEDALDLLCRNAACHHNTLTYHAVLSFNLNDVSGS